MIKIFYFLQAQDELSTAKSNYEALTHQLREELPIVIDAATNILINCISAFAHARKLLCGKITKRYLNLCEVFQIYKIKKKYK